MQRATAIETIDAPPVARARIRVRPTAAGAWLLAAVVVLLLVAVNYGNNLVFAMAFLLLAAWSQSAWSAWRQLVDLRVHALPPREVACGETLRIEFAVEPTDARLRKTVSLSMDGIEGAAADVAHAGTTLLGIDARSNRRGVHRPDRIGLASRWPFGWWRASFQVVAAPCIVYPLPRGTLPLPDASPVQAQRAEGADAFSDLRGYRAGDAPARIDWRAWARREELLTRQFDGERGAASRLLRWSDTQGDGEARLSQLARWILDADARGDEYGLDLSSASIAPSRGSAHRLACLRALAEAEPPR